MPIYQYKCTDCGEEFEYLIVRSDDQPVCPKCSSLNLEKQLPVFSVGKPKAIGKSMEQRESRLAAKSKPQVREHVGCSKSYVKTLLKKYG